MLFLVLTSFASILRDFFNPFPFPELQKMFSQDLEASKAMVEAKMRGLSQACDDIVATMSQVVAELSERSTELYDFRRRPLMEVPQIERLRVLPGQMEHDVAECVFHGGSMALGQMVSHFDKIDVVVIT